MEGLPGEDAHSERTCGSSGMEEGSHAIWLNSPSECSLTRELELNKLELLKDLPNE